MFTPVRAPADERELIERTRSLGGRTLREVADQLGVGWPADLKRAKGFVGQLVERALGSDAGSREGPDFANLGIELKTLPVDRRGQVRESTFVCAAPAGFADELEWSASRVRAKLSRVLFVVVDGPDAERERRIGAGFLWSPTGEQEATIRSDWEDLVGRIAAGEIEQIDARDGEVLQVRPKGANARARSKSFDADGAPFFGPRRAFYLRRGFTASVLESVGFA